MNTFARSNGSVLVRAFAVAVAVAVNIAVNVAANAAANAEEIPTRGRTDPALASFDELMTSFLVEQDATGASLAVAKDGRLVLARGYGWANREKREAVEPDSLFRIASISKPITAVAIFKLVEAGKLDLDTKIVDVLSIKPYFEPGAKPDPRLGRITVRQCLQHTAGFDRDASFDPMFQSVTMARALGVTPPAGPWDVIRFMWGRPLDFDPGTKYAYSNFGYCLLGRVIEKLGGGLYEDFVKAKVLAPIGVTGMRIGRTFEKDRAPKEVRYYNPGRTFSVFGDASEVVPWQYGGWYLEAMDSHGAWIASATDLVRFACALGDPDDSKLLARESHLAMFARPEGRPGHEENGEPSTTYYGCGWMVRPKSAESSGATGANHWHGGSLGGTSTILVRRHDGLVWAALFNQRVPGSKAKRRGNARLATLLDPLLHGVADAVKRWPDRDLFER